MIIPIKNYQDRYGVDQLGNVYSYCLIGSKNKRVSVPRKLIPYTGKDSQYYMVGLSSQDGRVKNMLVHRLVAQAFLPNPNNFPEVDHIDDNPKNNKASNLQWVTRQQNMDKMYSHSTPLRNYKIIELTNGQFVHYFISEKAASIFAEARGASSSSLLKYKKSRGWILKSVSTIPQGSSIWDENGCEVVPGFGYKT